MASLHGVSDEAIRTLRYRIKKKLNINDTKDIDQVVANLALHPDNNHDMQMQS